MRGGLFGFGQEKANNVKDPLILDVLSGNTDMLNKSLQSIKNIKERLEEINEKDLLVYAISPGYKGGKLVNNFNPDMYAFLRIQGAELSERAEKRIKQLGIKGQVDEVEKEIAAQVVNAREGREKLLSYGTPEARAAREPAIRPRELMFKSKQAAINALSAAGYNPNGTKIGGRSRKARKSRKSKTRR